MTPEQIQDRDGVWAQMKIKHPEFTHAHDVANNYHMIREIILGGSVTWRRANEFFKPFKGALVMDIGANVGVFPAYCALNGADVIAYEANPQAFATLQKMVTDAGLSNITPVNAAIWTHTGITPFQGHLSAGEDCARYNGSVPVEGVRWSEEDLASATLIPCIGFDFAIGTSAWDCVKMDIEGAEAEIILATSPEALSHIKFMYVEFHPWTPADIHNRVVKKLNEVYKYEGFWSDALNRDEAAYLTTK